MITTIRTMIINSSNTTEGTMIAIFLEEESGGVSLEEESDGDVLQDPEGRKVSHQLYIIDISSEIL